MKSAKPAITVIGSINMDLVVRCGKLPLPGQTVMAESCVEVCGGKGANQAVAAARAGGQVAMVGRVGDDGFADRLVANLQREQIETDQVRRTDDCGSGLAVVAVEQSGQNAILVVPGANACVTVADILNARRRIESSAVVLLQLEIPLDAVVASIEIAKAAGVRVILDPAPAPSCWHPRFFEVDLLCPNETEAEAFVGYPLQGDAQVAAAARSLAEAGTAAVAVTLGQRGTLLWADGQAQPIGSFPVQAVDTTAAGDAFAGALAVCWAEQNNLADAVRFGNAAGALAASREGAQPGMAFRHEIETLWRRGA